ncbi:MAG: hypothetical protein AB7R55_17430 [Gemmatimonadales bacterium]
MSNPSRRRFMITGGLAALGLPRLASAETPHAPAGAVDPIGPERFPGLEAESAADWDMSWVERVTGTYRMVFDAPEVAEGTILHQARVYRSGYSEVHGTKDGDTTAVLVIRHAAIPIVANDLLWDELELGRKFKVKDAETGKDARRNPFLNANVPRGAKHALIWPDGGLDTLIERGSIALACNLALFRLVGLVAKHDKIESPAARQKVLGNLVPGVIVQPSGIFAVARAQAAGCDYIRAT